MIGPSRLSRPARYLAALSLPIALAGCASFTALVTGKKVSKTSAAEAKADPLKPKPMVIRAFTETWSASSVLGAGANLWVGTTKGLWKWDLGVVPPTSQLLTTKDGLGGDRVSALATDATNALWVASAGGLARQVKGAWKALPPSSVGDPPTSMVVTADGTGWIGGPLGLAKLNRRGAWDHYLDKTPVTAVVAAGNDVWVGTQKHGILHVVADKKEDRVDAYGPDQGAELDGVVSSITATANGVIALGENKSGQQRVAFYDGFRFWSYAFRGAPAKVDWVRRVGSDALIGMGTKVFALLKTTEAPKDDKGMKMFATSKGVPKLALSGPAKLAPPEVVVVPPPVAGKPTGPTSAFAPPPPTETAASTKGGKGKKDAKASVAAKPAAAKPADAKAADSKPATAAVAAKPGDKAGNGKAASPAGTAPADAAAPAPVVKEPEPVAPLWLVVAWGPTLPENVTAVGPDGPTLFVGTRFLGAAKIDEKEVTSYRRSDLADGAERLTVACDRPDECWFTTNLSRAWHFDGAGMELADIDGEEGSKVLAVLDPPNGTPMSFHRGKADSALRVSSASAGKWSDNIFRDLSVPNGVPDLTYALVDGNKHLWLGLRYIDKDGDAVDWGTADIDLAKTTTVYHRQVGVMAVKDTSVGTQLPNDLVTACFPSPVETWFGTHSGLVRLLNGKDVQVFGKADGLEQESVHACAQSPDNHLWAATNHGIATFDGKKFSFPPDGDAFKFRATSLLRDKYGWVYVGGTSALYLTGPKDPQKLEPYTIERIATKSGLVDDHIMDMSMDRFGRVWVLSEKGISVIER